MAGPLIFEKNKIDLDFDNVTITASDGTVDVDNGQSFVNLVRNRRNDSGYGTGGSSDAGLTTLEVDMTDEHDITDILLVNHNFKAYTIQYWDGAAYQNFSTPIAETVNADITTHHNFTQVSTSKVKLIVQGTMTADQDKLLAQFIITKRIGQFVGEPLIKKPRQEKGRKVRKMLSGRANVTKSLGAFSCQLAFPPSKVVADFQLAEDMFNQFNGFLVWLCAGDVSNFYTDIPGFRLQDIYLMTCANDLETEWEDGHFAHGQKLDITLVESRI